MLAGGMPEVLGTDPALGQPACRTACSPSAPSGRHLLSPPAPALVLCHLRQAEPQAGGFLPKGAGLQPGGNPVAAPEPEPGGRSQPRRCLGIQRGWAWARTGLQAPTASRTKTWRGLQSVPTPSSVCSGLRAHRAPRCKGQPERGGDEGGGEGTLELPQAPPGADSPALPSTAQEAARLSGPGA